MGPLCVSGPRLARMLTHLRRPGADQLGLRRTRRAVQGNGSKQWHLPERVDEGFYRNELQHMDAHDYPQVRRKDCTYEVKLKSLLNNYRWDCNTKSRRPNVTCCRCD